MKIAVAFVGFCWLLLALGEGRVFLLASCYVMAPVALGAFPVLVCSCSDLSCREELYVEAVF